MHTIRQKLSSHQSREITLNYTDRTTKFARVGKLTKVISYKGAYFLRNDAIGFTYYEQVTGEELNNIEVV